MGRIMVAAQKLSGIQEDWLVKKLQGPSVGGWIGILYTTIWTFALMSGVMHASSIQGFTASFAVSVLTAGALLFVIVHLPDRREE